MLRIGLLFAANMAQFSSKIVQKVIKNALQELSLLTFFFIIQKMHFGPPTDPTSHPLCTVIAPCGRVPDVLFESQI